MIFPLTPLKKKELMIYEYLLMKYLYYFKKITSDILSRQVDCRVDSFKFVSLGICSMIGQTTDKGENVCINFYFISLSYTDVLIHIFLFLQTFFHSYFVFKKVSKYFQDQTL